mgnify:CR=1 FL=1
MLLLRNWDCITSHWGGLCLNWVQDKDEQEQKVTRKLSLNALGSGVATELEKYANDYSSFKYFTQNEATI